MVAPYFSFNAHVPFQDDALAEPVAKAIFWARLKKEMVESHHGSRFLEMVIDQSWRLCLPEAEAAIAIMNSKGQ